MQIEQIYYINLDRRPDRKAYFLTNMESAGVPMELVKRMPAKDWRDYDSVKDTLNQMYREDGFAPWLVDKRAFWHEDRRSDECRGETAYAWTMCKILKNICQNGKNTLVMHDDVSLHSWSDLTSCLDTIHLDGVIHAVQLNYTLSAVISRNPVVPYNHIWNFGIQTFQEQAVLYSFWGASRMLALTQGTHEHLFMVESTLLNHFNNRHTFHTVDSARFIKRMPRNPREIKTDEMIR